MKYATRICAMCPAAYTPRRVDQRTCSRRCKQNLANKERYARKRGEVIPSRRDRYTSTSSKACTNCQQIKLLSEFNKRVANSDGYNNWCRTCVNEKSREWYENNRERSNANSRAWKLRRWGLTEDELKEIVKSQGNKCLICLNEFTQLGKRSFVIDHDHESGIRRGIICTLCNTSIGHLGDNVAGLQRALDYLKSSELVCL